LIEGLVKQIHEEIGFEIRDALATHETNTNTRFFELVLTDQHHDERLSTLEAAATSFGDWKPEVESSLTLVRLELLKLNTFLDRDAKATCTPKPGVLPIESMPRSSQGAAVDGPAGTTLTSYTEIVDLGEYSPTPMTRSMVRYQFLLPVPSSSIICL
jgi:hypothetical protein